MTTPPEVTVLMPVHNGAAHVAEATSSIKDQTLEHIELLVVDDGSDDDSSALAEAAWGDRPGLRVLRPGRVGLIRALQLGVERARSPWIARMDADDISAPNRLAAQLDWQHANPELDLVGCLVECFGDGPVGRGYALYEKWINDLVDHESISRDLFVESPFAHPSVLFSRDRVLACGSYRDMGWPEDYDLWLRLARCGARFAKVPERLLFWRDAPCRHSRTHPRYEQKSFLHCKAHHLARGPLASTREVWIWGAGPIGRKLRSLLAHEGVHTTAFIDIDPRKIGARLIHAPILGPEAVSRADRKLILVAVGARGARDLIRARLCSNGLSELRDFQCVT